MISSVIAATVIAAATFSPGGSEGWVCNMLDRDNSESGVWAMLEEAVGRGYYTEADGRHLANVVATQCPEHIPALIDWAEANA